MKLKIANKAIISELKRVVEENPNSAQAHNNLGLIYGKYEGRYEEAAAEFRKALDVDSKFGDARCNLAIAYYLVENYDLAWRQVKVARLLGTSLDPGFIDALKNGGVARGLKAAALVDWSAPYEDVCAKRRTALVMTALAALTIIVVAAIYFMPRNVRYPKETVGPPVNLDLIESHLGRGLFDEAISACQRALKESPRDATIRNLLAQAYHGKGMWDQEIRERKNVVELSQDWPTTDRSALHNNLGVAYIEKDEYDLAIQECKRAIEFWSENAEAYTNLGFAYGEKGEWEEAVKMHKIATELKPSFREAHYNLALALAKAGRFDEAMSEAKLAEALGYPAQPLIEELKKAPPEP